MSSIPTALRARCYQQLTSLAPFSPSLPPGDFQADLHDDVADFTPEQCKGLVGWRDFYRKVGGSRVKREETVWGGG